MQAESIELAGFTRIFGYTPFHCVKCGDWHHPMDLQHIEPGKTLEDGAVCNLCDEVPEGYGVFNGRYRRLEDIQRWTEQGARHAKA